MAGSWERWSAPPIGIRRKPGPHRLLSETSTQAGPRPGGAGTHAGHPAYVAASSGSACRDGLLAAVIVEAALRLAAEPSGFDIFHQKRAGAVFAVGQAVVQPLPDRKT